MRHLTKIAPRQYSPTLAAIVLLRLNPNFRPSQTNARPAANIHPLVRISVRVPHPDIHLDIFFADTKLRERKHSHEHVGVPQDDMPIRSQFFSSGTCALADECDVLFDFPLDSKLDVFVFQVQPNVDALNHSGMLLTERLLESVEPAQILLETREHARGIIADPLDAKCVGTQEDRKSLLSHLTGSLQERGVYKAHDIVRTSPYIAVPVLPRWAYFQRLDHDQREFVNVVSDLGWKHEEVCARFGCLGLLDSSTGIRTRTSVATGLQLTASECRHGH